ncbi:DUF4249 family protein [Marinilabiliaceae bacterium ANBcel2]|nr:DUF4249 family protein [Marinilabiliaceae bacterium ANBcel2]
MQILYKLIIKIAIAIIFIFTVSCESDLDMQIKEGGGQLVLFSFPVTDSLLSLHLSRSVGHSSVDDFERIYDGEYSILINDQEVVSKESFPYNKTEKKLENIEVKEGDKIEIVATDTKNNRVKGSTKIPIAVPINRVDTQKIEIINKEGVSNSYLQCKISFTDPAEQSNFYQLIINEKHIDSNNNIINTNYINYQKEDPVFYTRDQEGSLLGGINFLGTFPDYNFKGKQYTLTVNIPYAYLEPANEPETEIIVLEIKLLSLTQEYFDYIRSRIVAEYNYDLPVVDPIKTYSNIEGGLGLVGGMSVSQTSLKFE